MTPRVIKVTETRQPYFEDDWDEIPEPEVLVYYVDESKWAIGLADDVNSYRCGYVEAIINAANQGRRNYRTSRKYSFSDSPEWWDFLLPDGYKPGTDHPFDLAIEVDISYTSY
jgi:hypothetical protein